MKNIAKNTSYFTLALIIQKMITFTYFAILARNLDPSDLGKYYLAISITTIFAIFIDLGMSNVVTRETARNGSSGKADRLFDTSDLVNTVISLKAIFAIFAFLSVFATVNLLGYPELTKKLAYIASVSMILDSFSLTYYAVLRGHHNLFYESMGSVVFQLIVFSGGLYFLKSGFSLEWVMTALAAASIFNFLYSFSLVNSRLKIGFAFKFDGMLLRRLAAIALPFAVYAIFQRMYTYLDTVFLSVFAGDMHVGYYQVAFKIIFSLQFLPMAFTASLYPAFASYYKNNRKQLVITFERAFNYLAIIGLPISAGIIFLADRIIGIFKPEYEAAILPLQVIMAALLFMFLNFPIGSLLNATDRQKANTAIMAAGLALSIMLNLLLIRPFGALGAAVTVVITNAIMFLLGINYIPRILKIRPKKILLPFLKSLFAAILMSASVLSLKNSFELYFVIPIAGILYFSVLLFIGGFRKEDINSVLSSFKK